MTKKDNEEELLNPTIEKKGKDMMTKEEMKQLATAIESTTVFDKGSDNAETFFKSVVKAMNDRKNISMKTEYLSVPENFNGTKLEFFSVYANMPYLNRFINIFETKRVSLNRKGRQEDVMVLQERVREQERQKMQDLNKLFNVGV